MCALEEKELVFEFFAGIGGLGLSRALELARQKVDHLVVTEKDPECRRLNKDRPAKGSRD